MSKETKQTPIGSVVPELGKRVEERFGVLPNFFCLAPETPEITEKLWGFAQAAYLDNPLPSVFKERLFVHLSRFCAVRYCIARHVGFLVGLGRPAGDANVRAQDVPEVVKLLRRPFPRGPELALHLSLCANCAVPLAEMPGSDSEMEGAIFAVAGHVFLQTSDAPACLDALERLLGRVRLQYLLLFLAFVRAAHYWTRVHPEIALEADINHLLATHEALADCILNDRESGFDAVSQSLLDELPALRLKADKAIGLLAAIVDSSEDAIVSKSLGGVITTWNAGAERLFGYTADEAVGQNISLIIPHDRRSEETAILEKIARGQRIDHFDTVRRRKDGSTFDISLTISPVRDATGKVVGASKIARDITERKNIERSLRESEERYRTLAGALDTQVQFRTQELQRRNEEILKQADQLRGLSGRLLQAQDEERRRVARDLHDSAGQTLAAMSISLARMAEGAKSDPAQLANIIHEVEELVQGLSQEIRTTSYLLYPPLLDEAGLSSALRWYVEGLMVRSGLEVKLEIPDNSQGLSREMQLVIFRVVQECLTNIHRHSGSKTASIRVEHQNENVYVTVEDSGKGMSPEKLSEVQSQGKSVGLRGMRERVHSLQGDLTIESSASGTKVSAILPAKGPGLTHHNETQELLRI